MFNETRERTGRIYHDVRQACWDYVLDDWTLKADGDLRKTRTAAFIISRTELYIYIYIYIHTHTHTHTHTVEESIWA